MTSIVYVIKILSQIAVFRLFKQIDLNCRKKQGKTSECYRFAVRSRLISSKGTMSSIMRQPSSSAVTQRVLFM